MKATKIIAAAITVTLTAGLNVSAFAGVAPNQNSQENRVQQSEQNIFHQVEKKTHLNQKVSVCRSFPYC